MAQPRSNQQRTVRLAVLGCGNVGSAFVGLVQDHGDLLAVQSGARLEMAGIAVADTSAPRPAHVPRDLLTADAAGLVADPSVDLVVELIGGLQPAGTLVRTALDRGCPVVTANKALLASTDGVALRALARDRGVDLLYEAAVAGAIPLVRALRESLTGERITRVMGIVNGTTNFILWQMARHGTGYDAALAEAQRLGYAESDPTADVEGHDAAAKAAILAGVAFGADVSSDQVACEGITGVDASTIAFAAQLGYVIKLLAVVERVGEYGADLSVRVHPAMVPDGHPLAAVNDAYNAVFIEGEAAGELMLYGQGAGGLPTASAVVGDVIDAVRNLAAGTTAPAPERVPGRIAPIDDLRAAYCVSLDVEDRPGALSALAAVFAARGVSIRSMEQHVGSNDGRARLVLLTHESRAADVAAILDGVRELDSVAGAGTAVPVIQGGPR